MAMYVESLPAELRWDMPIVMVFPPRRETFVAEQPIDRRHEASMTSSSLSLALLLLDVVFDVS